MFAVEKQCQTVSVSTNYTEANSAKIAVVKINRIEKVDQNKMTNTGT